jgi:hypothetical protein
MSDAEQAHGGRLVNRPNVGSGFIKPLNPVGRHLLV